MLETDPQELFRRVLVVDDEESVRTALRASIETLPDFSVDTACDAESGLAMVESQHYYAVFVDLVMPIVDGMEFLRRLRDVGEAAKPDRVFLASGLADPALEGNVRALGGHGILGKPFRLDDLRHILMDEIEPY